MIKNLVVSGCSFTAAAKDKSWANYLNNNFHFDNFRNLAFPGAGNFYIADSIIQCLTNETYSPSETLVLVMWSGPSRMDTLVSDLLFNSLKGGESKTELYNNRYVFSGGELGLWCDETFPDFNILNSLYYGLYKSSNESTYAHLSLINMLRLKHFLEFNNYRYKFMSYVNYWNNSDEYSGEVDKSILYYADNKVLLNTVLDSPWIWINENRDCLFEYSRNSLDDDGFHPSSESHAQFAKEIVVPNIQEFLK